MNWRAESIQIDWQSQSTANQLTGRASQRVSSEIRTARRTEDSHFKKSVSTKQNKQQYCLEIPQSREENLMIQEQSF